MADPKLLIAYSYIKMVFFQLLFKREHFFSCYYFLLTVKQLMRLELIQSQYVTPLSLTLYSMFHIQVFKHVCCTWGNIIHKYRDWPPCDSSFTINQTSITHISVDSARIIACNCPSTAVQTEQVCDDEVDSTMSDRFSADSSFITDTKPSLHEQLKHKEPRNSPDTTTQNHTPVFKVESLAKLKQTLRNPLAIGM